MKKIVYSVLLMSVVVLMSAACVSAVSNPFFVVSSSGGDFTVALEKKDPATWNIIAEKGLLTGYAGSMLTAMLYSMPRTTDYTLIYYGNDLNNDVWPYATCIGRARTNFLGMAVISGSLDYRAFLQDSVGQKFWVVLTSDVDCSAGKMVAWNPSKYLFEHNTV